MSVSFVDPIVSRCEPKSPARGKEHKLCSIRPPRLLVRPLLPPMVVGASDLRNSIHDHCGGCGYVSYSVPEMVYVCHPYEQVVGEGKGGALQVIPISPLVSPAYLRVAPLFVCVGVYSFVPPVVELYCFGYAVSVSRYRHQSPCCCELSPRLCE